MYLCVTAEDSHSSVSSPFGQRLDSGMMVLHPRLPMPVATQEGLLLAWTLNLHHHMLEHPLI